jgi:pyruvate,orthophosphate dikinase
MTQSLGKFLLAIDGSSLPDRNLIGGKAWSIARMRGLGLSVPPAFVITAEACTAYLDTGALPPALGPLDLGGRVTVHAELERSPWTPRDWRGAAT